MKKVMLVVSAIALVACFASCDKTCKCKTFVAGVSTETNVNLEDLQVDKCSDKNTVIETPLGKAGTECK